MQILIKDPKSDKANLAVDSQNDEAEERETCWSKKFRTWLAVSLAYFTLFLFLCALIFVIEFVLSSALSVMYPHSFDTNMARVPHHPRYPPEDKILNLRDGRFHREMRLLPNRVFEVEPSSADQIHLSMGSDSSELYVTWMTQIKVEISSLKYSATYQNGTEGPETVVRADLTESIITKDTNYPHLERGKRKLYTYRAKMTDLIPGISYNYWVVNKPYCVDSSTIEIECELWRLFSGTKMRESQKRTILIKNLSDPNQEVNLAFYGDLGLINGQSITRLTDDVSNNLYDLIIHNGDFAYDMDTKDGAYGDMFMRLIEPIASQIPYQTSVGNHEVKENFTHYDVRFTMVNSGGTDRGNMNNFYYSFDVGPIHFVAFSTEFYYFLDYSGLSALQSQYEWLQKDLAFASSLEQRRIRPWIVVFGHRPMYCSSRDKDDCTKDTNILRKGFAGAFALEKLFYEFGVDVELYSHEHQYERFLPIFDAQVYNGTDNLEDPYYNPMAPVHLISGSAGCQERLDPFQGHSATGSIKKIADYGFTRIRATRCRLYFQQVSDDKNGTIVDNFVISKTRQNFPHKTWELYNCFSSEEGSDISTAL